MPEPIAQAIGALHHLAALGGPVIWLLLAMAVFAVTLMLVKAWQILRFDWHGRARLAQAMAQWRAGHDGRAIELLHDVRHPAGRVLLLAMRGSSAPAPLLRDELQRLARAALGNLQSWMRALELVAVTAPLLGLLGTVLGMVEAFRNLNEAGAQADPGLLSSGIWQALLTTAAGLIVAVPATLGHGWLERRIERLADRLQDSVTQVFTRDLVTLHSPGRVTPRLPEQVPPDLVEPLARRRP